MSFSAVLALGAALGWFLPREAFDWQPARVAEAWRWWSAAFVHLSALHLGSNLLGCAVVGAFGWAARLPAHCALAWVIAWPLTHLGLLIEPRLQHYAGLSGVLHAGVAAGALWLVLGRRGRDRTVALAVLAGLALKIALEAPWRGAWQTQPGWDFAVAPLAHASGAVAGVACAALVAFKSRATP